jgi:hypothetical protein
MRTYARKRPETCIYDFRTGAVPLSGSQKPRAALWITKVTIDNPLAFGNTNLEMASPLPDLGRHHLVHA